MPELLERSENTFLLSFQLMDDEMEVSYEYDLQCMAGNGVECFGFCDVDSQFCELVGLSAARQQ